MNRRMFAALAVVLLLGEAYAFGVVWSFALKALGVLVLRYQRHDQEYKVPINLRIGGREIPIGLMIITVILGCIAMTNLFTKELATKYGIAFTIFFYIFLDVFFLFIDMFFTYCICFLIFFFIAYC